MAKVTIHGPNLHDDSKGTFRVHAAECSDNEREVRRNGSEHPWTIEGTSKQMVVGEIYGDHYAEQDPPIDESVPGDQFWTDVYLAPCCKLPDLH